MIGIGIGVEVEKNADTDQEFAKKWAASKDPFIEWIQLCLEMLVCLAGIVFLLSAAVHPDNLLDVAFRIAFGAALAFGFGMMASRHYAELKLARGNADGHR